MTLHRIWIAITALAGLPVAGLGLLLVVPAALDCSSDAGLPGGRYWLFSLRSFIWNVSRPMNKFNQTVHLTGASRLAQRQIERHRRLAPVADLIVVHE
jgi:hypothetical protein